MSNIIFYDDLPPDLCPMQTIIDPNTKISVLLQHEPDLVINTLIRLNGKFSKLKNPVLRNLLTKRVSISDACRISGTPMIDFFLTMEQIGFRVAGDSPYPAKKSDPLVFREPSDDLELDVRPILADGKDPLKEIMAAVKRLRENQGLKLINTFEPVPLIQLLAEKGFASQVSHDAADLVVTRFQRARPESAIEPVAEPVAEAEDFDRLLAGFDQKHLSYLDVRQLEMPGPMLAILAQTPALRSGEALFINHKKIPVYLLPELEKQGLGYTFKTIAPGNVHLLIYRK
jgi:uncharacterized protein (DUF2249 family)